MTEETLPVHSPLGASSAERWMNCPGSVALIKRVKLEQSDEADYRTDGIAAHAAAAYCLCRPAMDAWETLDMEFEGTKITAEMVDAVQVYIDAVRPHIANSAEEHQVFIEYRVSSPKHPLFYGTLDLAVIERGAEHHDQQILDLTDYKHGQGITVDADENPQLMYYAYGILQDFSEIEKVRLRIVQPRGFHPDGPVRTWETTAAHIREWAETVLFPAMAAVELDQDLDPGKWCRFCPAKLICPSLNSLFGAAMRANPKHIINLSDEAVGRSYQHTEAVKFYLTALEKEAFARLNTGREIPGIKMVRKKANRVWKEDASVFFKTRYGDQAMSTPELKSPAEMEKISPDVAKVVKEYAYTPQAGLTVALENDKRLGIKVQTISATLGEAALAAATEPAPVGNVLDAAVHKAQEGPLTPPKFLQRT